MKNSSKMVAKKSPQKIFIPGGTLNPNENNVIDIPIAASRSEIIIAQSDAKQFGSFPSTSSPHKQRSTSKADPATPTIEELEAREKRNFEYDLKKFQNSRRKLFFHVMSLQMTKFRKVPTVTN